MITPIQVASVYTCRLKGVHVPNEEFKIDLSGKHKIDGERTLTDDDVEAVDFEMYSENDVVAFPKLLFTTFRNLEIVEAGYMELKRIEPGTISNCALLESLTINGNKLQRLENGVFRGCGSLKTFSVNYNEISEIGDDVFADTPNLENLDISGNLLRILPDNGFKHLNNLRVINLSGSRVLDLPLCFFHSMQNIERISLNNNKIQHIQSGTFTILPKLRHLGLIANLISQIDSETFPSLISEILLDDNEIEVLNTNIFTQGIRKNLSYFRLQNNKINAIEPTFFDEMPALNILNMLDNSCISQEIIPDTVKDIPDLLQTCFENFNEI